MANNLPYINIYKGDFLRSNVAGCSIAAQGLWLRMMILMHDSERIGYLCLNNNAMPPKMIAIKCAVSLDEYEYLFAELMSISAFSTSREGIVFSPEIVAQEQDRTKNAERQKRFKENKKGNGEVTPEVTEKKRIGNALRGCASSSSSFSSGINTRKKKRQPKPPLDAKESPPESQPDYLERKQKEYPLIDVASLFKRYCDYCRKNGSPPTRTRFETWLDNEEPPMVYEEQPGGAYINPWTGRGFE